MTKQERIQVLQNQIDIAKMWAERPEKGAPALFEHASYWQAMATSSIHRMNELNDLIMEATT